MARLQKDEIREERIAMEIIVDAYGPEELAMSWYTYLEDNLTFPFDAECADELTASPLCVGDEVEVLEMAPEEECEQEMFVVVRLQQEEFTVPLMQLILIEGDDETQESMEDWYYWVRQGYCFE